MIYFTYETLYDILYDIIMFNIHTSVIIQIYIIKEQYVKSKKVLISIMILIFYELPSYARTILMRSSDGDEINRIKKTEDI